MFGINHSVADSTGLDATPDSLKDIRIGRPKLPEVSSTLFYELMLHWIEDCDSNHDECKPLKPDSKCLPTRLLDVGSDSLVHLLVTKEGDLNTHLNPRYMALSHPWGSSQEHDHFCTTPGNLDHRLTHGIALDQLPATFKHAVQVARSLNTQYLWIDSLCIVQGDGGDFDIEAKKMEAIFSSAYFVIAASRASGTSSGFLEPRPARKFIRFDEASGPIYVCEDIDDFQRDVVEGDLNKRGWVLQERALARRTIYFTESQTYWECGHGVRCETLAYMTKRVRRESTLSLWLTSSSNEAAFLGDANFPDVAFKSSKGARIHYYQRLYETYSRLHFTKAYDRPIAIAGLEQRLVHAFATHGGYGAFEGDFFGRSLLWMRDGNFTQRLAKIDFPPSQKYAVPTWSWMAYEGAITFMKVVFDKGDWKGGREVIRSPWTNSDSSSSSTSWHTGNSDERIDLTAYARDLKDLASAEEGIVYDQGQGVLASGSVKCVIVGREKVDDRGEGLQHYYVLLVTSRGDSHAEYQRVGVASLPKACIAWETPGVKVRIF